MLNLRIFEADCNCVCVPSLHVCARSRFFFKEKNLQINSVCTMLRIGLKIGYPQLEIAILIGMSITIVFICSILALCIPAFSMRLIISEMFAVFLLAKLKVMFLEIKR